MTRHNTWYEVSDYADFCKLDLWGAYPKTFDEVIEKIEEIVARAKAKGYDNDDKWLIIKCEGIREDDKDGAFLRSTVKRECEGRYDNGKVERYEEA